jgi:thioredoxin 1
MVIIRLLLGVLICGAIGALLCYLGKCSSGSCPFTANPLRGAIYGAVVGLLLASVLSAPPKPNPMPTDGKPVPVKGVEEIAERTTETSEASAERSEAVQMDGESDRSATGLQDERSGLVEPLTKESFLQKVFNYEQNKEWKFEGELPCIIDFYADWCGPCKIVEPILQELAQEYRGKLNIYRVDTQAEQELATAFGIQSIPSILFVPLNDKPQMAVGALPKKTLKETIKDVLKVE